VLVNQRPPEKDFREFDNEASLLEAKSRMPLSRLMPQFGDESPPVGKKWGRCPICQKKDTARITSNGQQQFFKCANSNCASCTSDKGKAWTELHYLKFKQPGLNDKDIFVSYLKMTGVWVERMKFKSPEAVNKPEVPNSKSQVPTTQTEVPAEISDSKLEISKEKMTETSNSKLEISKESAPEKNVQEKASAPTRRKTDDEGYEALKEFFDQLQFFEQDEALLFSKRGLTTATSQQLRFRSNPRTNKAFLMRLRELFSKEEVLNSGLWKRDASRRLDIKPNSQFCGAGIIRKLKDGEKEPDDSNTWVDEDRSLWGWVCSILIPYFDENNLLIGLRPHKGGGSGGTLTGAPRIYIPRSVTMAEEEFYSVVITEGEFKAAALWQMIGGGRDDDGEPFGVVALPGISFGKHYEIREQLDTWLREVKCRHVIVAYDEEEKGDPKLESFKADARKRFDSQIWARVLATDIALKLHIRGEVCVLPREWRNEKGKADWDGALARLVHEKFQVPGSKFQVPDTE
jgi:hypothetical protein